MGYQEPSKDLEEDLSLDADIEDINEDVGFTEEEFDAAAVEGIEQPRKVKVKQNSAHALSARRAIEDLFERKRLHKELDYLFDEEFDEGDE